MAQNLALALQITLIGMGLVFAAIVLLWALMALLVRLTPEQTGQIESPAAESPESDVLQRAAATAVAVALADRAAGAGIKQPVAPPPQTQLSAWQAVHRASWLNQKGSHR